MSMFQSAARGDQHLPRGVVVASYETYDQASGAIAKVSAADAEITGLAIVGNDLKLVERVTGRLTWGRVAGAGAMRGLGFGAFIGIVSMLLMPEVTAQILLFPLLGLAFGILLAVMTHAATRRKRDFASVQQVLATRYDVIAPQEIAGRAMHVIGQRTAAAPSTDAPSAGAAAIPVPTGEPSPGEPPVDRTPLVPGSGGATRASDDRR